jgi:hypothetical protein
VAFHKIKREGGRREMDALLSEWPLVVLVVSYMLVLQAHIAFLKGRKFFYPLLFALHLALVLVLLFIGATLPELLLCLLVGDLPMMFTKGGGEG